jgi:hypothetical protein
VENCEEGGVQEVGAGPYLAGCAAHAEIYLAAWSALSTARVEACQTPWLPNQQESRKWPDFWTYCCLSNARQEDLLLALKRKTSSLKILRMLDKKIIAKNNKRRKQNILG